LCCDAIRPFTQLSFKCSDALERADDHFQNTHGTGLPVVSGLFILCRKRSCKTTGCSKSHSTASAPGCSAGEKFIQAASKLRADLYSEKQQSELLGEIFTKQLSSASHDLRSPEVEEQVLSARGDGEHTSTYLVKTLMCREQASSHLKTKYTSTSWLFVTAYPRLWKRGF